MAPSSPARGQRRNSPFTKQQEAWVILQYGALSNCLAVRRKFRVHYKLSPFMVPRINAFRRLVSRFLESNGQVRPKAPAGRSPLTEELVQRVKDFLLPYTQNEQAVSLTTMATSLNISVTTAWRVVRKKLGWYPFKPRKVILLISGSGQLPWQSSGGSHPPPWRTSSCQWRPLLSIWTRRR